jgi:hypothetical protein
MKNKAIALMVLSVLSVIAVLGMASAVSLNSITQYTIPSSVDQNAGSFNIVFNLTNAGENGTLNWSASTVTSGASISFNDNTIANGSGTPVTETITATVTFPSTKTGVISGLINVTGTGMSTYKTLPFSVSIHTTEPVVCDYGNAYGNLEVKKIEFTNNGFSNTDFGKDDEWFPIDNIQVDITIKNKGNEKIEDIELEWGLYDPSNNQWVIEMDNEKSFDLKKDDDNVVTVDFVLDNVDVDLSDLEDGTYVFYAKATGYDKEYSQDICDLDSQEANIIIESDFVVLDKITIPETTSCGMDFSASAKVYNIATDDQEGVYVNIYNKELKIDQNIDIGDVDAFNSESLDATIAIPSTATAKTYGFVFTVYDENDDIYENDYNDDESVFTVPVEVTCTGEENSGTNGVVTAVVSASLESGGNAGQDLVIKSTITNLGSTSSTYTVNPTGYTAWASSVKADQSTFTLASGESKTVLFTFAVKDDVAGEQNFDIEVVSGSKLVTKQPVSVSIAKKGFSLSLEGFNYIWAIAILNIILVIAIIIVAIRVLRK